MEEDLKVPAPKVLNDWFIRELNKIAFENVKRKVLSIIDEPEEETDEPQ